MNIAIIIATIVTLIVALILLRIRRRYNAAMNALMARYTFDRLNREQQASIKEEAQALVQKRGLKIEGYANDVERFGWYAMAMKMLNIPSKLPENPSWFNIRNPSSSIKKGDVFLNTVSNLIKQNYEIDVRLS